MKLRLAEMADRDLLFAWRNDPLTRANSRFTAEVPYGHHVQWLAETLAARQVRLFVGEVDGLLVGTSRLDLSSHDSEVSITVAPEHRGEGYARPLLALTLEHRPMELPTVAQIEVTNTPSLVTFLKEGFVPYGLTDIHRLGTQDGRRWMWLRRPVNAAEGIVSHYRQHSEGAAR